MVLIPPLIKNSRPASKATKLIVTVLVVVPSSAVIRIDVVPGILVASVTTLVALGSVGVATTEGTVVVPPGKKTS